MGKNKGFFIAIKRDGSEGDIVHECESCKLTTFFLQEPYCVTHCGRTDELKLNWWTKLRLPRREFGRRFARPLVMVLD